ncbi:MAG TPA: AtpZ/AtpI family protein [Acidimicrobiales bacterium]|jgi:F0F1-type ATP synthase assembly protein I|nr:AtpZ/AtpI family protein [Acidimicrobiales bacterium]
MTSDDKRDLYRGFDDGYTHAMELALTPFVAAGFGYLIDRILGTVPVVAIVLFALAVIATFLKMYYTYDARMKQHDAESPWGRAALVRAASSPGGEKVEGPRPA